MFALSLTLFGFFLLQVFFLSLLVQVFNKTHNSQARKFLTSHPLLFFFKPLYDKLFGLHSVKGLHLCCTYALNAARFAFGLTSLLFVFALENFQVSWTGLPFILLALLLIYLFFSDFLPRLFKVKKAQSLFCYGAFFTSIYLTLFSPLLYLYLKISIHFEEKRSLTDEHVLFMREKVYDLIQESWPHQNVEATDRRLIESILKFKSKIVREVMVPRADVFALESKTPIKEAAKKLYDENYSRIPLYQDTLDNIVGVLFYKDFLSHFLHSTSKDHQALLEEPVEVLMKKPLYTPETTRISNLLQEFLRTQQHLALVVDEFGALEGVVTIEDLLEEIVGEIEDEYDEEEDKTHITQQKDAWIVDAKMTLHEVEETTKLKIPHHGDYDTIGGYVIHRAGKIPPEGLKISHDYFEIEVLEATEKQVLKLKVVPTKSPTL